MLTRDVSLQLDHAFLPWGISAFRAGYGTDDTSARRSPAGYFLSGGGLTRKLNRDMQLEGEVREDRQTVTQLGRT